MRNPALILASSSPYRRALLQRLRLDFSCHAPEVDEARREDEDPEALATRLARAKAQAVARQEPGALVIGSDQVASLDGQPFGKPGSADTARRQLERSSGRCVRFDTAVALARDDTLLACRSVPFEVQFRSLSASQIARYVELEKPLDCAGSFRWEGLGISLFRSLRGDDPTALEGLPLIALVDMLAAQGVNPLAPRQPAP